VAVGFYRNSVGVELAAGQLPQVGYRGQRCAEPVVVLGQVDMYYAGDLSRACERSWWES
jgi:hypothetical protein